MEKLKRKMDWVGRKVKTLRQLSSGMFQIPKGTVMTVRLNRAGLHLSTDPCSCCGVRVFISNVPEYDVELLPVDRPPLVCRRCSSTNYESDIGMPCWRCGDKLEGRVGIST